MSESMSKDQHQLWCRLYQVDIPRAEATGIPELITALSACTYLGLTRALDQPNQEAKRRQRKD